MAIKIIKRPPLCIIRLTDNFTIETAVATQQELEAIFTSANLEGDIIVDLSKVENIDASGLSAVFASMISIRAKGIRSMIYHPAQHVQDVMDTMEINGFFPLIASEEDLMSRLLE